MPQIQLRLRTPSGQTRLEVDDESVLEDLVAQIRTATKIDKFSLKYGYPLKDLDITPEAQKATSLKDLKLRGETIVVAPTESATPTPTPAPEPEKKPKFTPKGIEPDETSLEWPERGGYLVLRVMPDDNSCMCKLELGTFCSSHSICFSSPHLCLPYLTTQPTLSFIPHSFRPLISSPSHFLTQMRKQSQQ